MSESGRIAHRPNATPIFFAVSAIQPRYYDSGVTPVTASAAAI